MADPFDQKMILGRYRLIGRAGAGGYATVAHAFDTRLKRDVAIKCIKLSYTDAIRVSGGARGVAQYQGGNSASTGDAGADPSSYGREASAVPDSPDNHAIDGNLGENSLDLPQVPSFLDKREERIARRNRNRRGRNRADRNADARTASERAEGSRIGDRRAAGDSRRRTRGYRPEDFRSLGSSSTSKGSYPSAGGGTRLDAAARNGFPARNVEVQNAPLNTQGVTIPGLEEARMTALLNDANIVTVYDCVVDGDMCYVIMEYVEGKTLARILRELGNDITLDMVTSIFLSVAHALEVAHRQGVLHLDVKPENVIVNRDGVAKVTDFGLSTLMDASGTGTTGGGTIGYMPLEQMRRQPLDVRSDEWALASLTYEMLSGTNPFRARTLEGAEEAIETAEIILPSRCWDVDEGIDDVMFRALDPMIDMRYDSVQDFAQDLSPYLGDSSAGQKQLATVVYDPAASSRAGEGAGEAAGGVMGDRSGAHGGHGSALDAPFHAISHFVYGISDMWLGVIMRVASALSCCMICAFSLANIRFSPDSAAAGASTSGALPLFGLFSTVPILAWIILIAVVALGAYRPRFAFPCVYVLLAVTLLFNQAPACAVFLLLAAGAWWWFLGRKRDDVCACALTQPLFGSIGLASISCVFAGALLDAREAASAILMAAISAIAFAAIGGASVTGWDIASNFSLALSPSVAGSLITSRLISAISNPVTWIVLASWMAAGFLFSFFCRRGTKLFDFFGAVACCVVLLVGAIILPLAIGGDAEGGTYISSGVIAIILALALVALNVTDRVRIDPDYQEGGSSDLERI